jgi:hypothetical protein
METVTEEKVFTKWDFACIGESSMWNIKIQNIRVFTVILVPNRSN